MDPVTKTSVVRTIMEIIGASAWPALFGLWRKLKAYRTAQSKRAEQIARASADAIEGAAIQKRRVDLLWAGVMSRARLVAIDRDLAIQPEGEHPPMNTFLQLTDRGRGLFNGLASQLGELYLRLATQSREPIGMEQLSEEIQTHYGQRIEREVCAKVSPPLSQYECLVLASTVALETAFGMPLSDIRLTMPGIVN